MSSDSEPPTSYQLAMQAWERRQQEYAHARKEATERALKEMDAHVDRFIETELVKSGIYNPDDFAIEINISNMGVEMIRRKAFAGPCEVVRIRIHERLTTKHGFSKECTDVHLSKCFVDGYGRAKAQYTIKKVSS